MKKRHVLLSLLLVAALLISLLAACANNETPSTDTPNTNNNTPSSNTDKQPDQTPDADTDSDVPAQDFDPENPDEILFYFYDLYSHGDYGAKIIDAVNEITIPLIGVKVDIEWYDMGSYITKLGLSIADGTPVDLVNIMPGAPCSVATLHSNNQLMDVSELLPEYAPGAYELVKDYLGAFTYSDGIFGFPSLKNFSNNYYIMMREDILKELDLYITHPFEVAQILTNAGCRDEVIIAGLLHDTLEDTAVKPAEIEAQFGAEVLRLVQAETADKDLSWEERKQHTIHYLRYEASIEEQLLACADKLANMRSIKADYLALGDRVWERFNRGKAQQSWYYSGLIDSFENLQEFDLYWELNELYKDVFVTYFISSDSLYQSNGTETYRLTRTEKVWVPVAAEEWEQLKPTLHSL